ncbi:MAG: TlpA family protein disulfide reductase [Planctomycetes bacterium]|nr:TlpA family protein disulfide reductase [Planctomycetota bacterium]
MYRKLVCLSLLLLVAGCSRFATDTTSSSPKSGSDATTRAREHAEELLADFQPFDFPFALQDLNGKTVSLADYKGKVMIVDFWGTWCPPCLKEIPHFVELRKKHRAAGLEIVGVNYEQVPDDEARETVRKFVSDNGTAYPCVIGDETTQNMVPDFEGLPTTLFIDRSGKVRLMLRGYHSMQQLEAIVKTLLAETNSKSVAK